MVGIKRTTEPDQGPGAAAGERVPRILDPVMGVWKKIMGADGSSHVNVSVLFICAIILTFIGLLMVLSASGPELMGEGEDGYGLASRQGIWALAGFTVMIVFSRLPVSFFRKGAWMALLAVIVLLDLVAFTPLGKTINGSRNWLMIGGFTAQPSEAAKLVLVLWLAAVLTVKKKLLNQWKHLVVPIVPVSVLILFPVLWGGDLGTALILFVIIFVALFFAGVPRVFFGFSAATVILGVTLLALMRPYRLQRIQEWFSGNTNLEGVGWQAQNGLYALASGGFFGKGLGASRQKWSWIPEAHSDYIFAVLGEELGLFGTLITLFIITALCCAVMRVGLSSKDSFVTISSGTIAAWIAGQTLINIGMVVGFLPVIGVPLPFISHGGSALTFTLAAVGIVMAFARERNKFMQQENYEEDRAAVGV